MTDLSVFRICLGQAVLFYFQLSQGHQESTPALTLIYHPALQISAESLTSSRFSRELNNSGAAWAGCLGTGWALILGHLHGKGQAAGVLSRQRADPPSNLDF